MSPTEHAEQGLHVARFVCFDCLRFLGWHYCQVHLHAVNLCGRVSSQCCWSVSCWVHASFQSSCAACGLGILCDGRKFRDRGILASAQRCALQLLCLLASKRYLQSCAMLSLCLFASGRHLQSRSCAYNGCRRAPPSAPGMGAGHSLARGTQQCMLMFGSLPASWQGGCGV